MDVAWIKDHRVIDPEVEYSDLVFLAIEFTELTEHRTGKKPKKSQLYCLDVDLQLNPIDRDFISQVSARSANLVIEAIIRRNRGH